MGVALSVILAEVNAVCSAAQYTSADATRYINQGLQYVAGRVDLPGTISEEEVTVSYSTCTGTMPATCIKQKILSAEWDGEPVKVHDSWQSYVAKRRSAFLDPQPTDCFLAGNVLHAGPKLSTNATIDVAVFLAPDTLTLTTDQVTVVPDHITVPLLGSYAAAQIFGILNGDLAKFNVFMSIFAGHLAELKNLFPDMDEAAYVEDADQDWVD